MTHLMPMLYPDWWGYHENPHHILGQAFGHGFRHDDALVPHIPQIPMSRDPYHHLLQQYIAPISGEKSRNPMYHSTVKNDKDQFRVVLDIQQFTPEEITAKVVDKFVVVEGKHEDKQDEHGWIARQFSRKYLVPEECDLRQVKSSVSTDGVLIITAPRKHDPNHHHEKHVEIEITGKPMIRVEAENKPEKK